MIDEKGFRLNVGIILTGPKRSVFVGKRLGQDAWQFPQGGIQANEELEDALYRELQEEVGLQAQDVEILGKTQDWMHYRLPQKFLRPQQPTCIGQKQKWFILKLTSPESKIKLDLSATPEFDSWRWVDYWLPLKLVIAFKRKVYKQVLDEFAPLIFPDNNKNVGDKC